VPGTGDQAKLPPAPQATVPAQALNAPGRGRENYRTAPPVSRLFRHIGRDGSPNRILEMHAPEAALAEVTREHAEMAAWIRAQKGESGWDLTNPQKAQWRYIHVSKLLKSCREHLRLLVDLIEAEAAGELPRSNNRHVRGLAAARGTGSHAEAQYEADLLAALERAT
jgi:hypothetical protein